VEKRLFDQYLKKQKSPEKQVLPQKEVQKTTKEIKKSFVSKKVMSTEFLKNEQPERTSVPVEEVHEKEDNLKP
jgi:hypothetical protein